MSRLLLLCTVVGVGCVRPDSAELFEDAVVTVTDADGVTDAFLDGVDAATRSLHVALPHTGDDVLMAALLEKWQAVGDDPEFTFEVITDVDEADTQGLADLLDAGAPVTLANDGLAYFDFALVRDVAWTSDQTIMSHAYAIVDGQRVITASSAGQVRTGPRVLLELRGENLLEDLLIEHNQIFGGTDATTVTAFSSPAKSIADFRWRYQTTRDFDLEMWFGPQERPTKRVIDAVYGARSAVWVVTDDLANEGLAAALKEKAEWGFDVRVVVGPNFAIRNPALSRELTTDRGRLEVVQVTDVDALPSLVLVDLPPDEEGFTPHAMGMILTHELVSSSRIYRGGPVVTDQLIDGALWVLSDTTPDRADLLDLRDLFLDLFDRGASL